MKIIFLNNFFYLRGGSERVMFQEIELLKEKGHEVAVFSQRFEQNLASDYSDYFVEPIDNSSLKGIGGIRQGLNLINNRQAARNFQRLVSEFKPDVIHAHNIYGGLTTSVLAQTRRHGVPCVLTLHDYKLVCPSYLMLNKGRVCNACQGRRYYHCLKNSCHKNSRAASLVYTLESYYNKWLNRWDIPRYYICPSRFMKAKMLENGYSECKLSYIPNFINASDFQPNYSSGDYVLYAGRMSHEKGILILLQALKGSEIPLKIVGNGPLAEQVKSYIIENDMKYVSLEGYRSGDELAMLYQKAAFSVVPSQWYENAPMSILESYAYGKPVVGADIGGISEMVIDGKTGYLFEHDNIEKMRDIIVSLWSDRQQIEKLGKLAREMVETEYSAVGHYDKLMDLYSKI